MIAEEIKNIELNEKEFGKFGLTVGIVLVIISLILLYFDKQIYRYFSIAGGLLVISGIVLPKALKYPYKAWMILAVVLGFIMSRLILTILFYLIVTPIGFIAKLFGKDFIDLKLEKERSSYWNIRQLKEYSKIDTERQF